MYNKSHCRDTTAGQAISKVSKEEKEKIKKAVSALNNYCKLLIDLDDAEQRLLNLLVEKEEFLSLKAIKHSQAPARTGTSDPTHRKATEAMELFDSKIDRTKEVILNKKKQKRIIDDAMTYLSAEEQYIIKEQYFVLGKQKPLWEIARDLNYSESHCKRLKKKAINKIARNIKVEPK